MASTPSLPQGDPVEGPERTSFSLSELLEMEVEDLPCLFAPVFLRSGIGVLVGGSDTGKSSLLRQMAMCVAAGRDFLGWHFNGRHRRAYYFSSEDDKTLTARVVRKYNRTMLLTAEHANGVEFEFDFSPEELPLKLRQRLEERPADLVVIDALGDAFSGKNLNDNKEVRDFYAPFKALAREFDCLILFNHHTGKRTSGVAPSKDNTLGSQAIEAVPRIAMELRKDPDNEDIKHLCIVKANYLDSSHKSASHELAMDSNLVFRLTGNRVAFDELVKLEKVPAKPSGTDVTDIPDTFHRELLERTSAGGDASHGSLCEAIAQRFGISSRTAGRKFIPYYLSKCWISENANRGRGNSKTYSFNGAAHGECPEGYPFPPPDGQPAPF